MLSVRVKKRLGERRPKGAEAAAFTLDVGFDEPNGVTTLLGASGSGKTTTLRLTAGIVTPDEGTIVVGGASFSIRRSASTCPSGAGPSASSSRITPCFRT